jgi:hypothetical protein
MVGQLSEKRGKIKLWPGKNLSERLRGDGEGKGLTMGLEVF